MRNVTVHANGFVGPGLRGKAVVAGRRGGGCVGLHAADVRRLAGEFGAELVRAVREGELDARLRVDGGMSWYCFALDFLGMRWPGIAAKMRDETNDALCVITQAMLRDVPGRPGRELLRRALRGWAFVVPRPPQPEVPAEVRLALRWVAGASRPLADLGDPVVMRCVLEALRLRRDGEVAAAETQRHKRAILVNAVRYAVEQGRLCTDPISRVNWRVAKTVRQVDPRVVANPTQARDLLSAVSYVGGFRRGRGRRLVGLFAGMYYAGLRPAEAVAVALPDCVLPVEGWGRVVLHSYVAPGG